MEMLAFNGAQRPHAGWPQEACGIRGAAEGPGQVLGLGGENRGAGLRGPPVPVRGPPFEGSRPDMCDCGGGASTVCGTQRKRFPAHRPGTHTPFLAGDLDVQVSDTHSGPHCLWLVGPRPGLSSPWPSCWPGGALSSGVDGAGSAVCGCVGFWGGGVLGPDPRGGRTSSCACL